MAPKITMLKGICVTHIREWGAGNVFLLALTIFVMGFTGALGNGHNEAKLIISSILAANYF